MTEFVYLNRNTGDRITVGEVLPRLERLERWTRAHDESSGGLDIESILRIIAGAGPDDIATLEAIASAAVGRAREILSTRADQAATESLRAETPETPEAVEPTRARKAAGRRRVKDAAVSARTEGDVA